MKIEPCLYCGGKVVVYGTLGAVCSSCAYASPEGDKNGFKHNRLSRIVRAAEEYVKARQKDSGDYAYKGEGGFACGKYELLRIAVKGGRSDG